MSSFENKVMKAVSRIPKGKVTSYKEVARAIGKPKAYRAVGNALAKNPNPIKIPCHRVVKSSGEVGDYSLGRDRKIELLRKEGIKIKNGKVRLSEQLFKF